MAPEQYRHLLARLNTVRNTDELLDLELSFAPIDEDAPLAQRALFELACRRCHLAGGPAPAPAGFSLHHQKPARARRQFEVRGRIDSRLVRIGWADGVLFGSRYAIARVQHMLTGATNVADAERIVRARMAEVLEPVRTAAVA